MRAVVDVNVLISALLTRQGNPAWVIQAWLGGAFELVVSPLLLDELERTLAIRRSVDASRARRPPSSSACFDGDPGLRPGRSTSSPQPRPGRQLPRLAGSDNGRRSRVGRRPPSRNGRCHPGADPGPVSSAAFGTRSLTSGSVTRPKIRRRWKCPDDLMDSALAGWCGGGG